MDVPLRLNKLIPINVMLSHIMAETGKSCVVDFLHMTIGLGIIFHCCQTLEAKVSADGCEEIMDKLWSIISHEMRTFNLQDDPMVNGNGLIIRACQFRFKNCAFSVCVNVGKLRNKLRVGTCFRQ